MSHIDIVYKTIKEINSKSPIIDGIQTSSVPAYTGTIKEITGLELDEIHSALEILIANGLVITEGELLIGTGLDNYNKVIGYPKLYAV